MEEVNNTTLLSPFVLTTPEYLRVTAYIQLLKIKRERTLKDIETLTTCKQSYLDKPKLLLLDSKNKKLPRVPKQFVPSVPVVDFNKYGQNTKHTISNSQSYINKLPGLEQKHLYDQLLVDSPLDNGTSATISTGVAVSSRVSNISANTSINTTATVTTTTNLPNPITETSSPVDRKKKCKKKSLRDQAESKPLFEPIPGEKVRGRIFTQEKPQTFNKLWKVEEQRRLEELLNIYPEEEIASHRWSKIAKALGNRTPKQVASRTQKYFIKLAKEGKPVPGKIPNLEVSLWGNLIRTIKSFFLALFK